MDAFSKARTLRPDIYIYAHTSHTSTHLRHFQFLMFILPAVIHPSSHFPFPNLICVVLKHNIVCREREREEMEGAPWQMKRSEGLKKQLETIYEEPSIVGDEDDLDLDASNAITSLPIKSTKHPSFPYIALLISLLLSLFFLLMRNRQALSPFIGGPKLGRR
eukprot:Gb_41736 [translate_table: standard]